MKMSLRFLSFMLLAAVLLGTACETDFQLEGEWEDIPVIYTFIAQEDDNHYVRVERAFLEPGGNAVEIAKIPDSIYYDESVSVQLEKLGNGQIFDLERVNAEDEGIERQEGDFANSPNILYKLPASVANLRGGDDFRIIVERKGQDPATASSTILDSVFMTSQDIPDLLAFGTYSQPIRIPIRPGGEHARVFDLRFRINYLETTTGNVSDFEEKKIDWVITSALIRDESTSREVVELFGSNFFAFLDANLEPLPDGLRRMQGVEIVVTAVGREIEDYLRIAGANIGITSSQAIPIYTNVENGRGIVSSRDQFISELVSLDGRALDSLRNGSLTGDLNFVP